MSLEMRHWEIFGDTEGLDFAAYDGDIFGLVNMLRRCVPFH